MIPWRDVAPLGVALDTNGWKLWFIRLSGWPVFLTIVGATFAMMLLASVFFTWLSRHSALRAMLILCAGLAILGALLLAAIAILSHRLI